MPLYATSAVWYYTHNCNAFKMNYAIDIKEIILKESSHTAGNGTETFVYEPSVADEEPFGSLSLIGWVENKKNRLEFLPNLIASIIRREFYQLGNETAGTRFENALKKANAALADMEKTNKDIAKDVSFCAINIDEDKVRFSVFGDIIVLCGRAGEVIDMRGPRAAWPDKKKLFSTIISGDILPSDAFIFSTERVIDLFSAAGIQKLFTLPLAQQAEIITKIYEKNSAHIPCPDQAAILFEVKDARSVSPNRAWERIKTAVPPKVRWYKKLLAKLLPSKRGFFFYIALCIFAFLGWIIVTAAIQWNALRTISAQFIEAEARAKENTQEAAALLMRASEGARAFIPSLYFSTRARDISQEAHERLLHLFGMHQETPSILASLPTRAVKFTPRHLFNEGEFIYVFGTAPDMYLKVSAQSGETSFALLNLAQPFYTERMFAKDGDFYFINDTKKAAFVLFVKENTLMKVVKTLSAILATPSAQGERRVRDARYALQGENKIIKMKGKENKETFLLGNNHSLIDFDISREGDALFLLTKEKILVFPHQ